MTLKSEPKSTSFDAILLDMDGVLFHGDWVLSGAAAFLHAVAGLPLCFVTNNPIRPPAAIIEHFAALGLPLPMPEQIVTSADATAQWLAVQRPGFRYFAIGATGLDEALAQQVKADAKNADFVVVGEGPGMDYGTMTTAINLLLQNGAQLVCTNPDPNVDATVDGSRAGVHWQAQPLVVRNGDGAHERKG